MHALILVDLQYDFMPGGALAVPEGHEVVEIANQWMSDFELVVATQDWHPPDHQSFASQHPGREIGDLIELEGQAQVLWPEHCIEGTDGAELHAELDREQIDAVIQKGTDARIDSYSGFFDNGHHQATSLGDYLASRNVDAVTIMGLATDYCVKFTALDAIRLGLKTHVVVKGCRGVELESGDIQRALEEMQAAGVVLL
ncbi:nicotinamidase/pyrazinamidase [Gimesia panareensis]|uniref:Nicotinamidase n=1 Tax=Gimesia panareensis TaxID=2527978 RepID=A0A517QCA6_9PLAN|nr:bifunctional nicotinamidase/pyrazinamidase [Gimesia panareensis]QDT29215.1 nicotinamidase/pyrazinamidase [Gimesia panareensis]